MTVYLLSEQRLKADFLNDNIASELILPSIQTAQDIYLRQTLGDSLLDKICVLVREDELTEPYQTLLDEYIIIYLEYLAMAELCVPSTFKLGNIGVAQAYDTNVNTQTIQNVKYLESYYKQKASFYENRLTTFIQKHYNLYPEYNTVSDVTVSSETTLQCGIYLGGTTSKSKIINKSNNNTDVGNYVRYDKAQNLTELEKAQARENIGANSLDFNMDDYYTKQEVDTLVENIDVDLSGYYTKQQVNKIVDDIPIPQYTSELELDNVYSRSQVDTLIANVPTFSGDYEDLTNKPSIYTKAETDTLISNINGFSGDYNDLQNKPNVYTKSEVDSLINNIDIPELPDLAKVATSGSYTDLINTPDVYTKSETYSKAETFTRQEIVDMINEINYSDINNTPTLSTVATSGNYSDLTNTPTIPTATSQLQLDNVYSKSEIDLQFETVNTTLGNINNILETI